MSKSVSEFMSKGSVKRNPSGPKAEIKKTALKTLAGAMVLGGVLAAGAIGSEPREGYDGTKTAYAVTEAGDTLCSYKTFVCDSAMFSRMENLVNQATKSETGREVIKRISQQKTTLTLDDAGASTIGFYSPSKNLICLNKNFSDAHLQSCLIHEGKHAMQDRDFKHNSDMKYNLGSNIMISRTMEADAVATQTRFSKEMAEKGSPEAWNQLKKNHPRITKTFEENAKKFGAESDSTMKYTMLAWYKNKNYVLLYDNDCADFQKSMVKRIPFVSSLFGNFSKTVNPDELVADVCKWQGRSYAGKSGDLLKTKETAFLDRVVNAAMSGINKYMHKEDKSLASFYPVNKDGSVADKTFEQETAKVKTAVIQQKNVKSDR